MLTTYAIILAVATATLVDPERMAVGRLAGFEVTWFRLSSSVVTCTLLVDLLLHRIRTKTLLLLIRSVLLLLTFLILFLTGTIWTLFEGYVPSEALWQRYVSFISNSVLLLGLIAVLSVKPKMINVVMFLLIVSGLVTVLLATTAVGVAWGMFETGEVIETRLRGFFDDSGYFALHMVMVLGLSLGWALWGLTRTQLAIGILGAATTIVAIIWTGSRGALLAALVTAAAVVPVMLKKRIGRRSGPSLQVLKSLAVIGMLSGAVLYALILPLELLDAEGYTTRLLIPTLGQTRQAIEWPFFLKAALNRPFGYGPAYWLFVQPDEVTTFMWTAHNTLLDVWLTGGPVAVLLFIGLAIRLVFKLYPIALCGDGIGVGVLAGFLGVLVAAMFLDAFSNRTTFLATALAAAVVYGQRRDHNRLTV